MDDESALYNKEGLEIYYNKNIKNFKKVSFVVVELPNLALAYKNHPKKGELIVKIADTVLKGMKDEEMAARLSFNKFIALLNDRDQLAIKEYCLKIEETLNADGFDGYSDMKYVVKFGVYENPELKDFQGDMKLAESTIMYSTYSEKNIYYYTEEVNVYAAKEIVINKARKIALEQKQFVPYVIPRVSVKEKKVIGGEITCRWVDVNQQELYLPEEFMPIFESDGFIKQIDRLMFESACLMAQALNNKKLDGGIVAVNVSKKNFEDVNFVEFLSATAKSFNINNQSIEIGLTGVKETDSPDMIAKFISDLKQRGFRVVANGFGRSQQPISSLISTSYDSYKLDSAFFSNGLMADKLKSAVVDLMTLISRQEAVAVCDGVTDANTMDFIASVDENAYLQGDVISKPIPVFQFDALLSTKFDFKTVPVPKPTYTSGEGVAISNEEMEAQNERIQELERLLEEEKEKTLRIEQEFKDNDSARIEELEQLLEEERAKTKKIEQAVKDNELEKLKKELENERNKPRQQERYDAYPPRYDQYERPSSSSSRDYEIDRLRRELEDEREKSKKAEFAVRDSAIEQLKREMEALKKEAANKKRMSEIDREDEDEEEEEPIRPAKKKIPPKYIEPDYDNDDDDDEDYDDDDDYGSEDSDQEEEQLEKLMEMFKKKFKGQWEDEMMKKYPTLMMKHDERKSFAERITKLPPESKEFFNATKNKIMSYKDVTNVTKNSCDKFIYRNKVIAKIAVSGKSIKVYLPLDPNAYSMAQFPHKDASMKKAHAKTPFVMRMTSKLSTKRLAMLFDDVARENGLQPNPAATTKDYAKGMVFQIRKKK